MTTLATPQTVLDFWFHELQPADWWKKSAELDQLIAHRFTDLLTNAKRCELFNWRKHAEGRLAEIIVLDQFSRNIFRQSAEAFAADPQALTLSQEAVTHGFHQSLTASQQAFLFMPFMHSESALIHQQALKLYAKPGLEYNLKFEKAHKAIIDRFGRYPHRNQLLGRESTAEEIAFLKEPGSSF